MEATCKCMCMLCTLKRCCRIGFAIQSPFKMAVHIQKHAEACRNYLPMMICAHPLYLTRHMYRATRRATPIFRPSPLTKVHTVGIYIYGTGHPVHLPSPKPLLYLCADKFEFQAPCIPTGPIQCTWEHGQPMVE